MEPVTLTFTPTSDDFEEVARAILRHPARIVRNFGVVAVVFIMIFVFAIFNARDGLTSLDFPLLLILALFSLIPLYWFVINPRRMRRLSEEGVRSMGETMWRIDDDALISTNQLGEDRREWTTYTGALNTPHHYLLMFGENQSTFHIIPKRGFTSPEHEAAFRTLVERHLGAIR